MVTVLSTLSSPPAHPSIEFPRLFVERTAWAKILEYARQSQNYEINGFAYVTYHGDDYWLTSHEDVFITKQEVTPGSALVAGTAFAKAVYHASLTDRSDDLRLQWHSHVNGSAYFSGTDTTTIDSYGPAGMDWFVSLVMNKRGEVSARVDVFRPVRVESLMTVNLYDATVNQMSAQVKSDIAENVTIAPPPKLAKVRGARAATQQAAAKPRGDAE